MLVIAVHIWVSFNLKVIWPECLFDESDTGFHSSLRRNVDACVLCTALIVELGVQLFKHKVRGAANIHWFSLNLFMSENRERGLPGKISFSVFTLFGGHEKEKKKPLTRVENWASRASAAAHVPLAWDAREANCCLGCGLICLWKSCWNINV